MTYEKDEQQFEKLGVNKQVLKVLKSNQFLIPTPIQSRCIPEALNNKDIVGIAQTGTGKTLAFILPIVQNIVKGRDQAVVVAPTRELAIQVNEMFAKVGRPLGLNGVVLIGGTPIYQQIKDLKRGPDVVIATPGRLIDHLKRKTLNFNKVTIVVLDEADHMFDIGFLPDVQKILSLMPKKRQTLLFSATMPPAIVGVISSYMQLPVRIEIAPSGTVAHGITQELFVINRHSKVLLLKKILEENHGKVLIFVKTRSGAAKVAQEVKDLGHSAVEIHSDRSLQQRKKAMSGFKDGKYNILVATDIAARGINVSDISLVVNYDLPQNSEDYVHRVGRTARAGKSGKAISFVTPDQRRNVEQIEKLIKKTIAVKDSPFSGNFTRERPVRNDNRRSKNFRGARTDKKDTFKRRRSRR